jgi:hypothetical protein
MSTRAIAPIVGASRETVRDDISTDRNLSVERPATVTSLDGRTVWPARSLLRPSGSRGAHLADGLAARQDRARSGGS